MNKTWAAEYECQRCRHRWSEDAGPTQCPACSHLYIRWLNFYILSGQQIIPYRQHENAPVDE